MYISNSPEENFILHFPPHLTQCSIALCLYTPAKGFALGLVPQRTPFVTTQKMQIY
jgi:hypothetical protein